MNGIEWARSSIVHGGGLADVPVKHGEGGQWDDA